MKMCFRAGLLATAALTAALAVGLPSGQAFGSPEQDLRKLQRIIHEQQRKFAEQERRLVEQEKKLAEQQNLLKKQQQRLFDQQDAISKQQRLTHQQGLILTLQDQDIYELRKRQTERQWPTGSTTYGSNGTGRTSSGMASGYRVQSVDGPRHPGLILTGTPVPVAPGAPVAPSEPVAPSGRGAAPPSSPDAARPKSEKTPDQLLVEAGGVLLPPGTLQIETGVEYTHASADRLSVNGLSVFDAIIIGFIRADDIDRDVVTAALTTRLGIINRVQADVRVPGVFRNDRETLGVGTATAIDRSSENFNLGDITAGVSVQPVLGKGSIPAIILRADASLPTGEHPFDIRTEIIGAGGESRLVKPPTGSGFYNVGGTLTAVWTSDPVVFFAGGGYTYTLEREFDRFGTIDPGDIYRFFAGTNVALSDTVSLNISFSDSITGSTIQNGIKTSNSSSNDGRLTIGTSIGIAQDTSLLVSAGLGLTDESPDFTFTVSVPITFRSLF